MVDVPDVVPNGFVLSSEQQTSSTSALKRKHSSELVEPAATGAQLSNGALTDAVARSLLATQQEALSASSATVSAGDEESCAASSKRSRLELAASDAPATAPASLNSCDST